MVFLVVFFLPFASAFFLVIAALRFFFGLPRASTFPPAFSIFFCAAAETLSTVIVSFFESSPALKILTGFSALRISFFFFKISLSIVVPFLKDSS